MAPIDFEAPVAFYFTVSVTGGKTSVPDAAFKEVNGIESQIDIETVNEGGENLFQHKLPKAVKHPNLVLKRGVADMDSGLAQWCEATLEGNLINPIETKVVSVSLNDADGLPIRSWVFDRAYPIKWAYGGFDAMKNEIVLETVELAYHDMMRML